MLAKPSGQHGPEPQEGRVDASRQADSLRHMLVARGGSWHARAAKGRLESLFGSVRLTAVVEDERLGLQPIANPLRNAQLIAVRRWLSAPHIQASTSGSITIVLERSPPMMGEFAVEST